MKVKLGDIFEISSGGTPLKSCPEYYGGDIPWVKTGDLKSEYIYGVEDFITEDGLRNSSAKMYEEDTVLIAMYGATIGATSILKISACTNQACAAFIRNDKVIPEYLYYFLKSQKKKFVKDGVGGAQPNISAGYLKKVEMELLSIEEQRIVVDILDKITNIINRRNQELIALDNLIKARFVEMFESVQETCEIGYYIKTLIAGKSLAGESECENKVLKTGAVSFDYFDASQMKNLPVDYKPQKEHLVNVGDIIISRMNTAELTGAAAYVWSVPNKVYIPDRLWKAILEEKCNPIFVWQMLIQPSTKEQIQRECSGTSGSMKNISKAGMLGIKVKKVNIDMQNEFADFVKQVDKSKFKEKSCYIKYKILK